MTTQDKSNAGLFGPIHASKDDFSLLTVSIVAQYDMFVGECNERNLTPTYKLFTLWMDATHNIAKAHEFNAYSLMKSD